MLNMFLFALQRKLDPRLSLTSCPDGLQAAPLLAVRVRVFDVDA